MVRDRPHDWMPTFPDPVSRRAHPSSSAPGARPSRTPSAANLDSSDDEGTKGVTNRCSPKVVYSVISKFSEFKRELIRQTGFGGILELPSINKVNLKLSSWLLSKVDTDESCLVISDERKIFLHERDVGIVFGIPDGDLDLFGTEITPQQIDIIRFNCGLSGKDQRCFRGLEYVLDKHIDDKSAQLEIDTFKIAFVIYVIGHLLAPTAKHDQVNLDFWGAFKHPDRIDRYNWCRYVYCYVLEAAQKARDEVLKKGRVVSLSGCHLFLQVFFLDNINIPHLNKNHNILPRIKVFNSDSLRRMTVMCASKGDSDFASFIDIRSSKVVAYMRNTFESESAPYKNVIKPTPPSSKLPELPPNTPLDPETYVFSTPADFRHYVTTKYPFLVGTYALDFFQFNNALMLKELSKLRSASIKRNAQMVDWMVQHVGAQQLQRIQRKPKQIPSNDQHSSIPNLASTIDKPLPEGKQTTLLCDPKEKQNSKRVASHEPAGNPLTKKHNIDPPSFDLGIDYSPAPSSYITPKAQVLPNISVQSPVPFSISKAKEPQHSSSSNALSPRTATIHHARNIVFENLACLEDASSQPNIVLYGQAIQSAVTRLEIPESQEMHSTPADVQRHPEPVQEFVNMLHLSLTASKSMDSNCNLIVHHFPRTVNISAAQIKDTFILDAPYVYDIIDVLIRRFNQLDLLVMENSSSPRWRHFFESDFAMLTLGGSKPSDVQSVHNQFVQLHQALPLCQMIVVPVLTDGIWCSYMFDLYSTRTHILDPINNHYRFRVHQNIFQLICKSISECFDSFYKGLAFNPPEEWELLYPPLCETMLSRDDSPIAMLLMSRHYNGLHLDHQGPVTKSSCVQAKKYFIFEALSIDGNQASLPPMIARILN